MMTALLDFPERSMSVPGPSARVSSGRVHMGWWGANLTAAAPSEAFQPVWVDLDRLYPVPADGGRVMPDELTDLLVLTGRVQGRLRDWRRATDGRWIGLVDYSLHDRQGRSVVFHTRAAVPAEALTPIPRQQRRR